MATSFKLAFGKYVLPLAFSNEFGELVLRDKRARSFLKHVLGGQQSRSEHQPGSKHIGHRGEHLRRSGRFLGSGRGVFAWTRVAQFAPRNFAICAARITAVKSVVTRTTSSRLRSSFCVLVNAAWVSKTAWTGSPVSREANVHTPRS